MEIIDGSIMSCVVVYVLDTVVDTSDKFVAFAHFRNVGSDSFTYDYVVIIISNQ